MPGAQCTRSPACNKESSSDKPYPLDDGDKKAAVQRLSASEFKEENEVLDEVVLGSPPAIAALLRPPQRQRGLRDARRSRRAGFRPWDCRRVRTSASGSFAAVGAPR